MDERKQWWLWSGVIRKAAKAGVTGNDAVAIADEALALAASPVVAPPEAGGADRRLVERIQLLEAALKDAQAEHDAAREALGVHRASDLALGIASLRAGWEEGIKERERLEGELVAFARLWREYEGWIANNRADMAAIVRTSLHAKAERLSPSAHAQPPSGAPNTDASAS